jgi:hypothetical protein
MARKDNRGVLPNDSQQFACHECSSEMETWTTFTASTTKLSTTRPWETRFGLVVDEEKLEFLVGVICECMYDDLEKKTLHGADIQEASS